MILMIQASSELESQTSPTELKEKAASTLLDSGDPRAAIPVLRAAVENYNIVVRFLATHPGAGNFAKEIARLVPENDKAGYQEIEAIWSTYRSNPDATGWDAIAEAIVMIGGPVVTEIAALRSQSEDHGLALRGCLLLEDLMDDGALDTLVTFLLLPGDTCSTSRTWTLSRIVMNSK